MLRRGRFWSATAAAALAGCTSVTTAPSPGGTARVNRFTTPGVLRYSDGEDIGGLNLHIVPQVSVGWLTQFTGAYLIRFDDHSRPYPELLTRVPSLQNGDISRNGLTITYRLRRGAVWSDGAPFTADDVVFSFAAVNNPLNNEYSRAGFEKIADVGKKGDDTAIVRLKEPYGSFFITYFSTQNIPLLPKHLLGNLPNINDAPYNALPVGIGPFKYSVWRRNDAVEMIADPAYFRGRPKLDKIVYKTVTDWNTIETLLRTGELDLAVLAPSNVYDRLAAIPGFRGIGQPSALRAQIEFNCSKAPLDDPVVRHALRLAIDRRAIVAKVEHGHGYLTESLTGPLSPDDANLPLEPYDPKRAAALLDSRGWLAGPSGVRSKDGVPLTIEIANITGRPERDAWVILISSWWSAIGVRTSLKHY